MFFACFVHVAVVSLCACMLSSAAAAQHACSSEHALRLPQCLLKHEEAEPRRRACARGRCRYHLVFIPMSLSPCLIPMSFIPMSLSSCKAAGYGTVTAWACKLNSKVTAAVPNMTQTTNDTLAAGCCCHGQLVMTHMTQMTRMHASMAVCCCRGQLVMICVAGGKGKFHANPRPNQTVHPTRVTRICFMFYAMRPLVLQICRFGRCCRLLLGNVGQAKTRFAPF